ncbi:MAG: glucokinase [Syntrophorhabdaceae bacterium]|nr:glucokinase [Syntrophorhabdaceae bacterium]
MILSGDVGGTKTNLALYTSVKNRWRRCRVQTFRSHDYSSMEKIIETFLTGADKVSLACIGVAGPVRGGKCRLTNLSWAVDRESIRRVCNAQAAYLINDIQALAFAVPCLRRNNFAYLQKGKPNPEGSIAVAAVGTGFGQAALLRSTGGYLPLSSEGGHVDLAPRNEREVALMYHLKKKFGRVSVERVVSGPGIHTVYQFLLEAEKRRESAKVIKRLAGKEDPSKVIVSEGLSGESAVCRETIRFFCRLYGAVAGNLALQYNATGGVALGGGVTPAILPAMEKGEFMEAFLDKGRFREHLEKVPVKVILDESAALLGAARYAKEMSNR